MSALRTLANSRGYNARCSRKGLSDGLAAKYPAAADQPDMTEMQHRLLMAQVLEAVRALGEGVLEDIREGDVGAILGWGFPPWSGGPFSWLNIFATPYAAERCDQLSEAYGARFTTPELLRDMAQKTQNFHTRFGQKADAA